MQRCRPPPRALDEGAGVDGPGALGRCSGSRDQGMHIRPVSLGPVRIFGWFPQLNVGLVGQERTIGQLSEPQQRVAGKALENRDVKWRLVKAAGVFSFFIIIFRF